MHLSIGKTEMETHQTKSHFDRDNQERESSEAVDSLQKGFDESSYFCPQPWLNVALRQSGTYSFCCYCHPHKNDLNIGDKTLEQYFSDPLTQKRLMKLKSGKIDEEIRDICRTCINNEKKTGSSHRIRSIQRIQEDKASQRQLQENMSDLISKPTSPPPHLSVDLMSIGNKCHLRCYSCNSTQSSGIGVEQKKWSELNSNHNTEWTIDELTKGNWNHLTDSILKYGENLTYLSFSGGEPFIIPEFFKAIKKFPMAKLRDHLKIGISTGGFFPINKNVDETLDILKEINGVKIFFSIDGTEKTNRYIRYPSSWKQLWNNINTFRQRLPRAEIKISTTVSALSIGTLPDLNHFCKKQGIQHLHGNILHSPEFQQASVLPEKIKKTYLDRFNNYSNPQLDSIRNLLTSPSDMDSWKQLITYLQKLDRWRNLNHLDFFPEFDL